MSKPTRVQAVYFRMPARVKLAIDRLVVELKGAGALRFEDAQPTKEQVVCAAFLWLEELGPEPVARLLANPMRRYEALMRGEPDPGPVPLPPEITVEDITPEGAPGRVLKSGRPRRRDGTGG